MSAITERVRRTSRLHAAIAAMLLVFVPPAVSFSSTRAPAIRILRAAYRILRVSSSPITSSSAAPATLHVLFIGNSLTAANNLPAMVDALSAIGDGPRIASALVAFPDYSLEDHWNRGDAARAIAKGGWSTIVLQQGPSALPESRVLLIAYAKKFDAEAKRVGARTALYMVWPSVARRGDFDGVSVSYAQAAREVNGLFLPVGQAWRGVWRRDARAELYERDGFHPTREATYLAALVIVQQLSGRSPIGLPASLTSPTGAFPPLTLSAARATLLQEAAAEANRTAKPSGKP